MNRLAAVVVAALGLVATAGVVRAQPAPADPVGDSPAKLRAKALNAAAVQQSKAGNKAAALGLFQDAYREFPSPALLINIGTTQRELGQLTAAAATFEKFLADPARTADRVAQATTALAELAAQLTRVELAITAPDAATVEFTVDDGPWQAAVPSIYVLPGRHVVRVRGGGGRAPVDATIDGAAGATVSAALVLEAEVAVVEAPPPPPPIEPVVEARPLSPAPPPGRFGAMLGVAVDPASSGVTGLVAVTIAAHPRVQVNLGGMLGGNRAGFVTATAVLRAGQLRPTATVGGVLAFYSWSGADHGTVGMVDRTLVGVHGAVGVEWWPGARLGVSAEAVAEYYPSGEPDIHPLTFTPTLGVRGRL